ncbi:hypothetical protein ACL2XO_04955 [Sodalis sp. RH15]|uniref:hypothetical protein n=1 Tax=Sodalis sp. RH15 TaxID=3394330 RepID=UPI0039B3A6B1
MDHRFEQALIFERIEIIARLAVLEGSTAKDRESVLIFIADIMRGLLKNPSYYFE